jgi:hypothetical protein
MVKPNTSKVKVGDIVRVMKVPPKLTDSAGIDTPGVFARALGKTFRVEGISERGHLQLVVAERKPSPATYESDTIWIEPDFVQPVSSNASED